jgi:hypothetical protein
MTDQQFTNIWQNASARRLAQSDDHMGDENRLPLWLGEVFPQARILYEQIGDQQPQAMILGFQFENALPLRASLATLGRSDRIIPATGNRVSRSVLAWRLR